jgi:hypothetical protein
MVTQDLKNRFVCGIFPCKIEENKPQMVDKGKLKKINMDIFLLRRHFKVNTGN